MWGLEYQADWYMEREWETLQQHRGGTIMGLNTWSSSLFPHAFPRNRILIWVCCSTPLSSPLVHAHSFAMPSERLNYGCESIWLETMPAISCYNSASKSYEITTTWHARVCKVFKGFYHICVYSTIQWLVEKGVSLLEWIKIEHKFLMNVGL